MLSGARRRKEVIMAIVHSRNLFLWMGVIASLAIWLIESVLHYTFFDRGQPFEWIPGDANEFWMRTVICVLVILAGIYVQRHVNSLIAVEEEKLRTLQATMRSVHDIVGNALNHLELVRLQAEESGTLPQRSLHEIDQIIDETTSRLGKLANMKTIRKRSLSSGVEVMDAESGDDDSA